MPALNGLRMNFLVVSVMTALLCLKAAYADDYQREEQNGYTWCFTVDDGEATIIQPLSAYHVYDAIEPEPVGRLVIPSELGGCPVTAINSYVFYGYDQLTEVIIPQGVKSVHSWQKACPNVTFVSIPESLPAMVPGSLLANYQSFDFFPGVTRVELANPLPLKTSFPQAYMNVESITFTGKSAGGCEGCRSLRDVKWTDKLIGISSCAFDGCVALVDVSLPRSVTSVGKNAFRDTGWWNAQPDGLVVLDGVVLGCKNYNPTKLVLPEGLRGIAESAFENSDLVEVKLPSTLEFLDDGVFRSCTKLATVEIPGSVPAVGYHCFEACYSLRSVTIGDGCQNVSNYAFKDCSGMVSVRLPDTLERICAEAFMNCSSLRELTLPPKLREVSESAFKGCSRLKSISIPPSVVTVDRYAFDSCTSLESVSILSPKASIGDCAFYNCTALRKILFEPVPRPVGAKAFENTAFWSAHPVGAVYLNGALLGFKSTSARRLGGEVCVSNGCQTIASMAFSYYANKSDLTKVTIPESVKEIGSSAFDSCLGLREVSLPHVERIQNGLFDDCQSLVNVTLPDGVTVIEAYAFRGCRSLTKIDLPQSIVEIDAFAFANCVGIRSIGTLEHIASLGASAFSGCESVTNRIVLAKIVDVSEKVFKDCKSLAGVEFAENVRAIGNSAFYGCGRLTEVHLPKGIRTVGDYAFYETGIRELTVPDSVRSLGEYAFGSCSSLTALDVRFRSATSRSGRETWFSGCENIGSVSCYGELAHYLSSLVPNSSQTTLTNLNLLAGTCVVSGHFGGCPSLRSVTIPEGVEELGHEAFENDTGLENVFIPRTVGSIGYSAFDGCSGLTNVFSFARIGFVDFAGCGNIRSVTAPSCSFGVIFKDARTSLVKVTVLPDETENSIYGFGGLTALKEIVLPNNVRGINDEAFKGCTSLASLSVPSSVVSIGYDTMLDTAWYAAQPNGALILDGCMVGCKSPGSKVVLPDGCRLICDRAFDGCTGVSVIELPSSVRSIGSMAFSVAAHRAIQDDSAYEKNVLSVYFRGDAPSCADNIYAFSPEDTTTYVTRGSKGWNGDAGSAELPSYWMGEPILPWDGKASRERPVVQLHTDPNEALALARSQGKLLFVLSGADWCPYTSIVKNCLTKTFAVVCDDYYVVYYCNIDRDTYGMADGVPSYGVFDPDKFGMNWHDGRLAYNSGGVKEYVENVLMDGCSASQAAMKFPVRFDANGGTGTSLSFLVQLGRVFKLPPCTFTPPAGKRFAGWACSNGRRYDDGMLVFDLAKPGETVTMTAIWE